MATFTEAEISDLCEILECPSNYLAARLDFYASQITDSDKTKVLAKVDEWTTAGGNFTAIMPTEANFGAKINPNDAKAQIRRQIAQMIYCGDMVSSGGSQIRLERG